MNRDRAACISPNKTCHRTEGEASPFVGIFHRGSAFGWRALVSVFLMFMAHPAFADDESQCCKDPDCRCIKVILTNKHEAGLTSKHIEAPKWTYVKMRDQSVKLEPVEFFISVVISPPLSHNIEVEVSVEDPAYNPAEPGEWHWPLRADKAFTETVTPDGVTIFIDWKSYPPPEKSRSPFLMIRIEAEETENLSVGLSEIFYIGK